MRTHNICVDNVGETILVEDARGKGHLSKPIGGQKRYSIFAPVE